MIKNQKFTFSKLQSCLILIIILSASSALPEEKSLKKAESGKKDGIYTGSYPYGDDPVKWAQAAATLNAPMDRVLVAIRNYAQYAELIREISRSNIVRRQGPDVIVADFALDLPFPFNDMWAYVLIEESDMKEGGTLITARMIRGNMATFLVSWRVKSAGADGSDTFVQVDLRVIPDFPVPVDKINKSMIKAARKMIICIKKQL